MAGFCSHIETILAGNSILKWIAFPIRLNQTRKKGVENNNLKKTKQKRYAAGNVLHGPEKCETCSLVSQFLFPTSFRSPLFAFSAFLLIWHSKDSHRAYRIVWVCLRFFCIFPKEEAHFNCDPVTTLTNYRDPAQNTSRAVLVASLDFILDASARTYPDSLLSIVLSLSQGLSMVRRCPLSRWTSADLPRSLWTWSRSPIGALQRFPLKSDSIREFSIFSFYPLPNVNYTEHLEGEGRRNESKPRPSIRIWNQRRPGLCNLYFW